MRYGLINMLTSNFQTAQVMQWPPAICNYMRKVRLKYQHVIAIFQLTDSSLTIQNQHYYSYQYNKTKKKHMFHP